MTNNKKIQEIAVLLENVPVLQQNCDRDKVLAEYEKNHLFLSGVAIKILSIFGGIMASLAFIGFLAILGIYDSEIALMFIGALMVILSVLLNKYIDNILLDTFTISLYGIGVTMIGMSLNMHNDHEDATALLFIGIGLGTLLINRTYILSFLATLLVTGSLLFLIFQNEVTNFLHVYLVSIAVVLAFLYFKEARILLIHEAFSRLYNPIRVALVFSLIAGLIMTKDFEHSGSVLDKSWVTACVFLGLMLFVVYRLMKIIKVEGTKFYILGFAVTIVLIAPTIITPTIVGSLFLILLTYYAGHHSGVVIASVAFIYFISQFYYDLNFTLLTKSIVLMVSGLGFIVMSILIGNKFLADEQN